MKPYPEYKASAIASLGNIPAHWERLRIKHLLREIDARSVTGNERLLSMRQNKGLVPHNDVSSKVIPSEVLIGYKKVYRNIIVMNRMRASTGFFAVAKEDGLVSPDYAVFEALQEIDFDYLIELFKINLMRSIFRQESRGMGTGSSGFLRLYTDRFGNISIHLPPIEEQQTIARYLKAQNAMVNKFIRNKRRLIALLKEQKQNIINSAVTRGLKPDVKMKPSGVDWLGDIPEHWEMRRLRTLAEVQASNVDKNSYDTEQPVLLCNYVDVYKNDFITSKLNFMKATASQEEITKFLLNSGDIIITKDSESWNDIAVPAFVKESMQNVLCGYHLTLIRHYNELIRGEFLFRAFLSNSVAEQFRVAATGVTRFGLSQGAIKGAFFPLPPLVEQQRILDYITENTMLIDTAISRAECEIDLMREYRDRLIADVVTGQIDVRGMEVPEVSDSDLMLDEIRDLPEFDDAEVDDAED